MSRRETGRLEGKSAIVTGAAKGLGAATARLFAAEGANILICDVDEAQGEATASKIGNSAAFAHLDVRSEAEWAEVVATAERKFGKLDVLVNNAGIVELGTPESVTEADYRRIMAISVDGVVFGCKHAIPAMRRAGGGSIVNMASIAACQGEPNVAAYCAAKGAVDAYSRAVAVYCAQQRLGIRCNSVLPAGMETPMVRDMPGKFAAAADHTLITGMPYAANERGTPDDVAQLLLYLSADESRWVSGQSIVVDNSSAVTRGFVPPRST